MSPPPHIMFAGGGTSGSLFQGVAVATHLSERLPSATISFAGPGKPHEKHTVRSAGFDYTLIPSQPAPQNPLQALRFVTDNVAGYCAARWVLREQNVSLVVGLGGHTSTAVVRAVAARGIPFILLEQNAIPSRTTRWLSCASAMVCAAYEEVRPHLHVQAPVTVTGNPSRPAFEQRYYRIMAGPSQGDLSSLASTDVCRREKRLIVLGGAGGARSLNESMPSALRKLGESISDWRIVHQTGEGQLQETELRYRKCGVKALAVTYIDQIASVLFESDLVVCRAGGTTLAELALAGVPALLVPYPLATDDHQIANAKVIAAARACRLIDENSQSGSLDTALAHELTTLATDEQLRRTMSENMRQLARPQASADIATVIHDTLYGPRNELLAA